MKQKAACLDSHSDGTHSLQSIHWWASDVMLNLSKSVLMKKQTPLLLGQPEGVYIFNNFIFWVNYFIKVICCIIAVKNIIFKAVLEAFTLQEQCTQNVSDPIYTCSLNATCTMCLRKSSIRSAQNVQSHNWKKQAIQRKEIKKNTRWRKEWHECMRYFKVREK